MLGGSVLQQRVPESRLEVSPSVLQGCEGLNGLLSCSPHAERVLELFSMIDQDMRPVVFRD